jgi:uncharacterized protein YecE (DUF72 family)
MNLRIGTAGWTIPKICADQCPLEGTHLQRYAQLLTCVEINSSFHRPHQRKTWERWSAATPDSFRFSVKLPKSITHTAKLMNAGAPLQTFLDQARGLGEKLGPLLVQLPPSLAFDAGVAHEFFTTLRELHAGNIALEPRNAAWFTPQAERMLSEFEIARVAADPAKGSARAAHPGGWAGLRYYRMHGAPRTYYSEYSDAALTALASSLREATKPGAETWVIFDNTALGHATSNALALQQRLRG